MLTPEEALRIARGEDIENDRRRESPGLIGPFTIGIAAVLAVSLLLAVASLCIPQAGKLMFGLGICLVIAAFVWAMILSMQDGHTWQSSIPLFWIYFALQDPPRWGKPVLMHFGGFVLVVAGMFLMHGPGVAGLAQGWQPPIGLGGALFRPAAVRPKQGAPRHKLREPPSADAIEGLVAYWNLDTVSCGETRNDVFGGQPARVYGATVVPGVKGKALQFDGAESYVELAPSSNLSFANGASFTWVGWVQTTSDGTVVSQRNRQDEGPVVDVTVEAGHLCATVRCDGPDLGRARKIGGAHIADGTWHHFALTRDAAGNIELFLDAQSQSQTAGADGPITTNFNFLGQERYWATLKQGPGQPYFVGLLDECCLYDRVLKPAELRSLAGN